MSSLKPNIDVALFKLTRGQKRSGSINSSRAPIPLQQLEKEFSNNFEPIDITSEAHMQVLNELFPSFLLEERDDADWELFLAMSRYDRENKTFVTGCFDTEPDFDFKLIAYKHRHLNSIKWKTRAGTSPNGTPFARIFSDTAPIYVIEGHRDALTAVLLGLDFIMIPYAGFKLKDPRYLRSEVRERDVVFLIEDKSAYICMSALAPILKETAKSLKIVDYSDSDTKTDLSDFTRNFSCIKEVYDACQNLG